MADDANRQMTIPELLKARDLILARIRMGAGGGTLTMSPGNNAARLELEAELRELEIELAEHGYKDAPRS